MSKLTDGPLPNDGVTGRFEPGPVPPRSLDHEGECVGRVLEGGDLWQDGAAVDRGRGAVPVAGAVDGGGGVGEQGYGEEGEGEAHGFFERENSWEGGG